MQNIKDHFCPNPACEYYEKRGVDNLVKAGTYTVKVSGKKKQMLKCTVCGMRFSETQSDIFAGCHYDEQTIRDIILSAASGRGIRATARELGLSKDRVHKIILKAGVFVETELSGLLNSLHLKDDQLNELWLFAQKYAIRKR